MANWKKTSIRCTVFQGAFSDEFCYTVTSHKADGSTELYEGGVVKNAVVFEGDVPTGVEAYELSRTDKDVVLFVPGGDIIRVALDLIVPLKAAGGEDP